MKPIKKIQGYVVVLHQGEYRVVDCTNPKRYKALKKRFEIQEEAILYADTLAWKGVRDQRYSGLRM